VGAEPSHFAIKIVFVAAWCGDTIYPAGRLRMPGKLIKMISASAIVRVGADYYSIIQGFPRDVSLGQEFEGRALNIPFTLSSPR
jgi:hypothetical protein